MKILFVTPDISPKSGGGVFTNVILTSLKKLGHVVTEYRYPLYASSLQKLKNQLCGYTMGMTSQYEKDILNLQSKEQFGIIIFNGSRFGKTLKKVKRMRNNPKVICIFHNMEFHFIYNAIKITKKPESLLTLLVTWLNERKSVKHSNILVALSHRDSNSLLSFYGREADVILPLCITDRFNPDRVVQSDTAKIGAFIGSNFYANNKGIKWFCENVSDKINCNILVVGKGFEDEKNYFSKFKNIKLIGTVDNVDEYYYNVDFIVSPIFDGSGMKTKTAEALMFGKTIIGTKEAFEGYDLEYAKVGAICQTADDFINEINYFDKKMTRFNDYSRSVYLEHYSQDTIYLILKRTIELC